MRRVAVLLASVAGAGYFPVAPGTVGSAVGLGLYLLTRQWPLAWQCAMLAGICAVGTWASTEAAQHFGREDPGHVVIDEVAGQLMTLLATGANTRAALVGFLIFRALDIVKPWPANRFERLAGGLGIMADDVMAGIYGNLMVRAAMRYIPGLA